MVPRQRRGVVAGGMGRGLVEFCGAAAASSVDPVYLSGERLEQRPIEVNSGASEDGRSRVLEA